MDEPIVLPPGSDEPVKADRPELSLLETTFDPGSGVDPHFHKGHSDSFYVLEGELEFHLGDEDFTAAPGSFVLAPPNVVHHFRNTGDVPARCSTCTRPEASPGTAWSSATCERRESSPTARSSSDTTSSTSESSTAIAGHRSATVRCNACRTCATTNLLALPGAGLGALYAVGRFGEADHRTLGVLGEPAQRSPRRGRRTRSGRPRGRPRSSGGRPAPPSTSGRRRATPRARASPARDSRRAASSRPRLDERRPRSVQPT